MLPKVLQQSSPASDAVFDALGNPVRRDLLRRLAEGPASVSALAATFPVTRPAISRHLAVLEAAGLVRHQQTGTSNIYAVDDAGLSVGADWLNAFWDAAGPRLKMVAENLGEPGGPDE